MIKRFTTPARYLTSFFATLLIPVLLLTGFLLHFVLGENRRELYAKGLNALSAVQSGVEVQLDQLNAHALQASLQSCFASSYIRRNYTAFYEIEAYLNHVQVTNAFVYDLFYYNLDEDKVYGVQGVYTFQEFLKWGAKYAEADVEGRWGAILQRAKTPGLGSQAPCFLPEQRLASGNRVLTYVVPLRQAIRNTNGIYIFLIDVATLQDYVAPLLDEPMNCVSFMDGEGQRLCAISPTAEAVQAQPKVGLEGASEGDVAVGEQNGEKVVILRLGARSTSGLTLHYVIRWKDFNRPAMELARMFFAVVAITMFSGIILCLVSTNRHYKPLKRLEQVTLALHPEADGAVSEVEKAIDALTNLSIRNVDIQASSLSLEKEQLIMRFVMGEFPSTAAFNEAGRAFGLPPFQADFRMLIARVGSDIGMREGWNIRLVEAFREALAPDYSFVYLEYTEAKSILFVLSPAGVLQALKERMQPLIDTSPERIGFSIRIGIGEACRDCATLSHAYLYAKELMEQRADALLAAEEAKALRHETRVSPPEDLALSAINALQFAEETKLRFALSALGKLMEGCKKDEHACRMLFQFIADVSDAIRKSDIQNEGLETRLLQAFYQENALISDGRKRILDRMTAELTACMHIENNLLERIVRYIRENYRNPDFSAQQVAEVFCMSVSNLSHYMKLHAGQTVSSVISACRMRDAVRLLTMTDLSIANIAKEVGFWQASSFMRWFKQEQGVTATDFRRRAAQETQSGRRHNG